MLQKQPLVRQVLYVFAILCLPLAGNLSAADDYAQTIKPLLVKYCQSCHNAAENKGDLNLARFATGDELAADAERLQGLLEAVGEGFMPPAAAKQQPTAAERKLLIDWLSTQLQHIAEANAGDPGKVVLRRLTNSELNYTLADLIGLERDWTKDFPHDGSGGEGFSNTGQTLQMSASQIEKYLALAQRVSEHALMLPGSGPIFLESPVAALPDTERGRLALLRLDQFCRNNKLVYQDITPREQITSYAYSDKKSIDGDGFRHMTGYKGFSSETPGATLSFLGSTHRLFYRTERLNPTPFTFMIHRGEIFGPAGEPLTDEQRKKWEDLWLDLRYATQYARPVKISLLHRWFSHQPYRLGDNPQLEAEMQKWKVGDGKSPNDKRYSLDPNIDLSFTVLALADYVRDIRSFTPEQLRDYANIQHSRDGESRTLMVPNHDAFDAFIQLSFSDVQIEELWQLTCDPQSKLAQRLGDVPSKQMQEEWKRWSFEQQKWQLAVSVSAQEALCQFAERAWRRPLSENGRQAIHDQFTHGMADGQSLQQAMQLPLLRIFMSPHFLYRMEFGAVSTEAQAPAIQPLGDFELANRLSYFLWSSLPDEQLWQAAQRRQLSDPQELANQARRMLHDPRIRRFSREMFGQWLGFYRFQEFDRPDAERFPEFDAELREQMYGEAIDFCTDLAANDRDIRLLLTADYAFLPRRLAEHYGVPLEPNEKVWANFASREQDATQLVTAPRISLAETNRRGVLGWGAMLTATAHPLRTSPVLRGNWILEDLLGIPTPPPPSAVPELPEDEKNDQGLTIAQLLARHRQDKACSVCHDRIDPLGVALEEFDPIGRFRARDINGNLIEASSKLHDGTALAGVDGLVDYLGQEKQTALFVKRFSRKMLGYALGREVLPGDTALLEEINTTLAANDYRFSLIVEAIVRSPQFRNLRRDSSPGSAERNKP